MSFHKMVFYLKEAHVMVQCDNAPLWKFINSLTKNDKVNNWSQEIHAITLHIDREHIKKNKNIL